RHTLHRASAPPPSELATTTSVEPLTLFVSLLFTASPTSPISPVDTIENRHAFYLLFAAMALHLLAELRAATSLATPVGMAILPASAGIHKKIHDGS
ncbi:hypothetical protein PIB30_104311, partial [Stylosanthes scabra]|nr:hypothetical protein [Stylosanthes scabra]